MGYGAGVFYQVEITTHCNYKCFYCAGRDFPQAHMPRERFLEVVSRLAPGRHTVSLQGEGEPTVHPDFWAFVSEVAGRNYIPYTITNGSHIDPQLAERYFPALGFSLDTVDAVEAHRIGRLKLSRALRNLEALVARMGPSRIIIHTVDYGQDLAPVRQFVASRRLRHFVQPLQRKADYAKRYPGQVAVAIHPATTPRPCRYLASNQMRFFSLDGTEFPCCYIKDATNYPGIEGLRQEMLNHRVPYSCRGCAEIPDR